MIIKIRNTKRHNGSPLTVTNYMGRMMTAGNEYEVPEDAAAFLIHAGYADDPFSADGGAVWAQEQRANQ